MLYQIIILRAASNAGKTTFANFIKSLKPDTVIVSADDYFEQNGQYNFDASKLGEAHSQCKQKFKEAVDNKEELIIVSNTNTKEGEFRFYQDYGEENGYRVTFLVLEKRHEGVNNHRVPEETLRRQANNISNSLKLL